VLPRRRWAVIALASHPSGRVHAAIADRAGGGLHGVGAWAEGAVAASDRALRFQVGPDAGLHAALHRPTKWSRRALGGSGLAQLVPGLGQYWHPWAMGGVAEGEAMFGGVRVPLDGMSVYAEKNWGRRFPERWWWGQADAFDAGDVCVAFAGGPMRVAGVQPRSRQALAGRLSVVVRRRGRMLLRAESRLAGLERECKEGECG
jgi:tocopherol cyclase